MPRYPLLRLIVPHPEGVPLPPSPVVFAPAVVRTTALPPAALPPVALPPVALPPVALAGVLAPAVTVVLALVEVTLVLALNITDEGHCLVRRRLPRSLANGLGHRTVATGAWHLEARCRLAAGENYHTSGWNATARAAAQTPIAVSNQLKSLTETSEDLALKILDHAWHAEHMASRTFDTRDFGKAGPGPHHGTRATMQLKATAHAAVHASRGELRPPNPPRCACLSEGLAPHGTCNSTVRPTLLGGALAPNPPARCACLSRGRLNLH